MKGELDELGIEPRTFRILEYAKRTLYQLSHTPDVLVECRFPISRLRLRGVSA